MSSSPGDESKSIEGGRKPSSGRKVTTVVRDVSLHWKIWTGSMSIGQARNMARSMSLRERRRGRQSLPLGEITEAAFRFRPST